MIYMNITLSLNVHLLRLIEACDKEYDVETSGGARRLGNGGATHRLPGFTHSIETAFLGECEWGNPASLHR